MKPTIFFLFTTTLVATATDRTWQGLNADWIDGGNISFWTPNDEPDSDDRAIFNTNNNVNLGSNNTINGLALSGGIDLFTRTHILTVNGDATLAGANSRLNVGGNNLAIPLFAGLYAENITLNGGQLNMGGTTVNTNDPGGNGSLVIASGATLFGNGTVFNGDSLASATSTVVNNGTITAAEYRTDIFIGAPAAHTLLISASDSDARIDLDGSGTSGTVNVFRNQTLEIGRPLSDHFNGTITMTQNSILDFSDPWTLAGGSFNVDNGAVGGIGGAPAGTATISGGTFVQSGGTLTVADADGSLVLASPYTGIGGTLVNNGTLTFAADSTIANGHTLDLDFMSTTIVDGALLTVTDDDFDMNSPGFTNWTIRDGGELNLSGDHIGGSSDSFNGIIRFEGPGGPSLRISVADGEAELGSIAVAVGSQGSLFGTDGTNIILTNNCPVEGTLRLFPDFTGFSNLAGLSGSGLARLHGPVVILDDTTFSIDQLDMRPNMETFTINPGVTFTGTMNSIEDINNSSDFIVNGGTANVSTSYTFGDTSRMILAENGVGAVNPTYTGTGTVTFASGSTLDVISDGASFTAESVFEEGSVIRNLLPTAQLLLGASGKITTLDGGDFIEDTAAGGSTFQPAGNLFVTGNSRIEVTTFDWDNAFTTVGPGATLDIDVGTIDVGTIDLGNDIYNTNATLDGGTLRVATAAGSWEQHGGVVSSGSSRLQGDRVFLGDDAGNPITGLVVNNSTLTVGAPLTLRADARFFVASGASLVIAGQNTIFSPVNGASNGSFTGSGDLLITNATFQENTLIDMPSGSVELDGGTANNGGLNILGGADNQIDATLTINAATMENYGFLQSSNPSELHISNTGQLAVNLTNPAATWTVLPSGIINYTGDNATGSIFAGSDINLNGTLNVTGDGASDARLLIGGTINILTSTEDFSLAAGTHAVPDELVGGTINGPGRLSTLGNGFALSGYGTINAPIDFNGSSDLTASGGLLVVNGPVDDMGTLHVASTGTLDLGQPFDSDVTVGGISLTGGTLQGADINLTTRNLRGYGLVTNKITNDNTIAAENLLLILNNPANDWDGSGNSGILHASSGDLGLQDNAAFPFSGTVRIDSGRTASTSGFAFDFQPGSTLDLNGGIYTSNVNSNFRGTIDVSTPSAIDLGIRTAIFHSTIDATINSNLFLESDRTEIRAGATFSGNSSGKLTQSGGGTLILHNSANVGVTIANNGELVFGTTPSKASVISYQQGASGVYNVQLNGLSPIQVDTLTSVGTASLDGGLVVTLPVGYTPALGNEFLIVSALSGYTGTFSSENFAAAPLPPGLKWTVDYRANSVVLIVESEAGNEFADYIDGFGIPNPADRTRDADPDGDGDSNLTEFALNDDPTEGAASGKCAFGFNDIGTGPDVFTFTVPIRDAATFQSAGVYLEAAENLQYDILSSEELAIFDHAVTEVTGPFAAAIEAPLPPLDFGWSYRTFRHSSSLPVSRRFLRIQITDTSP